MSPSLDVPCSHWSDCGIPGAGCCAVGEFDRPSRSVCLRVCSRYDGPARGAGDIIAAAIKAATLGMVKPCGGCTGRQNALNDMLPTGVGRASEG